MAYFCVLISNTTTEPRYLFRKKVIKAIIISTKILVTIIVTTITCAWNKKQNLVFSKIIKFKYFEGLLYYTLLHLDILIYYDFTVETITMVFQYKCMVHFCKGILCSVCNLETSVWV